MIIKVPKQGITAYELKYFFEADTSSRKNIRKITLNDSGKASVNGVENNDDEIGLDMDDTEEDDQVDTSDNQESDVATDTDDDIEDSDIDDENIAIDDDDIDMDDEEDPETTMNSTDGDSSDTGGNSEDNSEVAIDDSDDAGNTDGDGTDDANSEEDTKNSEDKKDSIQKLALFQDFQNMHEALGKYIEKINMLIAYNTDCTSEYQAICDKFDELRNYLYEYMLVKFTSSKYMESVLFYQTALTSLYLILDDLNNVKSNSKNVNKKAGSTRKHNSKSK